MQRTPEVRVVNTRIVAPNVQGTMYTVNPYRRDLTNAPAVRVVNATARAPQLADYMAAIGEPLQPERPGTAQEKARKAVDIQIVDYIYGLAKNHNKNYEDVTFEEFYAYVRSHPGYRNFESILYNAIGDERITLVPYMERTLYENQDALWADYVKAHEVYAMARPVMRFYTEDDLAYLRTLLQQYIITTAQYFEKNPEDVTLSDFHTILRIQPNPVYLQFSADVAKYYGLEPSGLGLERFIFEQAKQDLLR